MTEAPAMPEEANEAHVAPQAAPPRRRLGRLWARISLRTRLVVALLVLSAIGLAVTGAVGNDLLRKYLVNQTDERLGVSARRFAVTGRGDGFGGSADPRGSGGLPNTYVYAVYNSRGVLVVNPGLAFDGNTGPKLSVATLATAQRRAGAPFTVESRNQSWRVVLLSISLQTPISSGGQIAGTEPVSFTVAVSTNLSDVDSTVARLLRIELLAGLGVLVVLAGLGTLVVRLSLRPLTAIEETAEAIGAGDLSRRVPDAPGHTEVGRLSGALNGMLTQIEGAVRSRERSEQEARASEVRMRQFVADAGHELRTPLTSIRGFAELHRQRPDVPAAESSRLLGRIETEATRMGGLVDDLLLLARLDQRRPLDASPIDLLPIAADAAFDAHTLAPGRTVGLDLPSGHPAPDTDDEVDHDPVVVCGDEAGIRQILSNFVTNALRHTPEGTPVRIALRVEMAGATQSAVLEVADSGPGLTPEQAARVFERFYRVDSARSRADGGSGLGLSIAAALAEAMGGQVEVDTAVGQGAAFRVRLPLATDPT